MAIETLPNIASELSSYIITLSFTDETGNAVTPDSVKWTLTDLDGNVINNRQDVVISSLSSSVPVVLEGDDLLVGVNYRLEKRMLTIEGTYTSSIHGELPITGAVIFTIDHYRGL